MPSGAPAPRRASALGFVNNRPFMLPENSSSPQVMASEADTSFGSGNVNGNNGSNGKTISTSSSSSMLTHTPTASTDANFGPPLLGDTSRRLTYPLSSPNQKSNDPPVENALSALHPALTNDMLAGTVAGGSIGMGIANNTGYAPAGNMPYAGNYQGYQVPPPTAANINTNGMIGPAGPAGIPFNGAQTVNYPPVNTSVPRRSSPFSNNYARNSFNGYGNDMNKHVGQQINHRQSQSMSGASMQQQGMNNQRTNLGLNATANVHRKHSSNKRRGEDASKFINASLNDFVNEIYFLCKDQHGCRFLQRQLEIGGSEAATKIFNEIQLNVIELMIDPFGNYLIQKLLERVNEEQRTVLVRNASSQFVRIALDPHGTRALQKLVECISTPTEFQIIINSLSSYIVLLSRDLNGNHVVQKCLQRLPPASCDFIFDAACENCVKIAKHRHGCCVLQRCFDHGTPEQCERLSLKVGENCVELSIDPYGNYVVQYVLSMEENRLRTINDPQAASKVPNTEGAIQLIISALSGNLTRMSTHKFGSNVIEKSLRIPTLSPLLIMQLLKETTNLKLLLHDAYGNYVLQTSLDVADDASFKELSELLKPYLGDVRNTPHGRRILSKLVSRGGSAGLSYNAMNGPPHPQMHANPPAQSVLDGNPSGFPSNIWA
ncbi:unnamed protein product [Ambrosiozyma monospora]|uniref:Unnamed protein product n=1 Tax=Ambrosiozyma monospora TaxID=43982 RepID=A0A9W6YW51_AMBMO|nr:unnamed protein product [Ambrosiozyma monospora]